MDENNQYNKQYSRYIRWSEEDNCWVCVVPELPGCQADGDTPQEVWDNAECIIKEWKETAKQFERDIPKGVTREIKPHMKRTVVVKPIEVVQVIPHEMIVFQMTVIWVTVIQMTAGRMIATQTIVGQMIAGLVVIGSFI